MGFFNLQVTVVGHASLTDISTTTRPFFACPSVLATSMRDWSRTKSNPASAVLIGCPETGQAPKKGHRSTPKSWFWTVSPLIRYQELTPQSLPPNHQQG